MEINNRKIRKKNVIFCNVSESTSSDDDLIFIKTLLDPIKDDIVLSNIKTFRLGKFLENQSRPRLLKVMLQDLRHAQWLIFNYKSLNWNNNVVCKSDSTPF